MPVTNVPTSIYQRGATLIELVVGMVVLAIALLLITVVIAPQASRSVQPVLQVRATELAQSLLNEMMSKSFDEYSDRITGIHRCDEPGFDSCSTQLGPDTGETSRADFDDVDDYHGLALAAEELTDSTGSAMAINGEPLYGGFSVSVRVVYDGDFDGTEDTLRNAKLMQVAVTMPNGQALTFASYRGNF